MFLRILAISLRRSLLLKTSLRLNVKRYVIGPKSSTLGTDVRLLHSQWDVLLFHPFSNPERGWFSPSLLFLTPEKTQTVNQTRISQNNFWTHELNNDAEVAERRTATNNQRTQARETELVFRQTNGCDVTGGQVRGSSQEQAGLATGKQSEK